MPAQAALVDASQPTNAEGARTNAHTRTQRLHAASNCAQARLYGGSRGPAAKPSFREKDAASLRPRTQQPAPDLVEPLKHIIKTQTIHMRAVLRTGNASVCTVTARGLRKRVPSAQTNERVASLMRARAGQLILIASFLSAHRRPKKKQLSRTTSTAHGGT